MTIDDLLWPIRNLDEAENCTVLMKEANRRIQQAFKIGKCADAPNPPNAVSGAATPAQQPSIKEFMEKVNAEAYGPATPEAQIPECVHAPEIDLSVFDGHTPGPWSPGCLLSDSTCKCSFVFSEGYCGSVCRVSVDNGKRVGDGGNDAPPIEEAKANLRLITAAPALLAELRDTRAQLAALRVERDQAWNEALDMTIDCGEEIGMTERMRGTVRSLARPIPAEPVSRKESPNGVD